jgi:hypothetical protein
VNGGRFRLSRSAPVLGSSPILSGSMDSEIIVKGIGEARSMPDRAIIHCAIDAEGSSRESAYIQGRCGLS